MNDRYKRRKEALEWAERVGEAEISRDKVSLGLARACFHDVFDGMSDREKRMALSETQYWYLAPCVVCGITTGDPECTCNPDLILDRELAECCAEIGESEGDWI